MLKSTQPTLEDRLIFPVGFLNMSALAAPLTGIPCININNTNSLSRSFIGQKLLKLKKRPLINLLPLSLSQGLFALFSLLVSR